MASRRMTRETFDAIMQVKAKRYRLDRSDPIDEALHQLRAVHSRPVTRAQYDEEEEDFNDGGKFIQGDWRKDARDEYSLPSYRSSSHVTEEEEDYYSKSSTELFSRNRNYGQPSSYEQDYTYSSSVERDYAGPFSREWNYGHSASREPEYGRAPLREPSRRREAEYDSPKLLGDFRSPGLLDEDYRTACGQNYDLEPRLETEREFSSSLNIERGRGLREKHGMAPQGMPSNKEVLAAYLKKRAAKTLSPADDLLNPVDLSKQRTILSSRPQHNQRPGLASQRGLQQEGNLKSAGFARIKEPDLKLKDPSDIFAKFGVEIIKWAGFHEIKTDPEYSELFRVLFTLETETCAKMLASFKCLLKAEHQHFCMASVKLLQHASLRTPKVDSQFLRLLMEKKVMATKNCFFEVIKPFDQYVMRLQYRLLRSTTPLLMACNAYELSIKTNSFSDSRQMATAFETTISLCCKSLVLLGQTFALASAFRQEKILEALSIQELAPPPILFPNFDTSDLFGREYIEELQSWLEKSGCQMRLKKPAASSPPVHGQWNVVELSPGGPRSYTPGLSGVVQPHSASEMINSQILGATHPQPLRLARVQL